MGTSRTRVTPYAPTSTTLMAPRTLASLAHSLAVAPDLGGAVGVLGEALAELDRGAYLAYFRYDGRRDLLTDRLSPTSVGSARPTRLEVAFDQLPITVRQGIAAGSAFVDVTERAADFARLLGLPPVENATLSASAACVSTVRSAVC